MLMETQVSALLTCREKNGKQFRLQTPGIQQTHTRRTSRSEHFKRSLERWGWSTRSWTYSSCAALAAATRAACSGESTSAACSAIAGSSAPPIAARFLSILRWSLLHAAVILALSANALCMKAAARSCSSSVSASPAAARAAACCAARSTANEPSPSPSVFSSFSGGTAMPIALAHSGSAAHRACRVQEHGTTRQMMSKTGAKPLQAGFPQLSHCRRGTKFSPLGRAAAARVPN